MQENITASPLLKRLYQATRNQPQKPCRDLGHSIAYTLPVLVAQHIVTQYHLEATTSGLENWPESHMATEVRGLLSEALPEQKERRHMWESSLQEYLDTSTGIIRALEELVLSELKFRLQRPVQTRSSQTNLCQQQR